jgi:hypothetical protein
MPLYTLFAVSVKETVKLPDVAETVVWVLITGRNGVVYTSILDEKAEEYPKSFWATKYIVYVFAVNPVFTYDTMGLYVALVSVNAPTE